MWHGIADVVRGRECPNRNSKARENPHALRDVDKRGDEGLSSGCGVWKLRGKMEVQGRSGGLVT
jgi:hypothetical protein